MTDLPSIEFEASGDVTVATVQKQLPIAILGIVTTEEIFAGRQRVTIPHGIAEGRPPLLFHLQFSPDEAFDDFYIVQWPWGDSGAARGPVSIRVDTKNVYLDFTGGHLFGAWKASTNKWQPFYRGFFRIVAF